MTGNAARDVRTIAEQAIASAVMTWVAPAACSESLSISYCVRTMIVVSGAANRIVRVASSVALASLMLKTTSCAFLQPSSSSTSLCVTSPSTTRSPAALAARTLSGVRVDRNIGDPRGFNRATDLPAGQAISGDDHVVSVRFVNVDASRLRAQKPVQPRNARCAAGQTGSRRDSHGGEQHGQDDRHQEVVGERDPQELGPGCSVQKHKRELSHLAQRRRRQDADAQRQSQEQGSSEDDRELTHEDRTEKPDSRYQILEHIGNIQQHTHGNERKNWKGPRGPE